MPTIVWVRGYRLFFVSFDGSEPMHVHVRKDSRSAKVWVSPLAISWSGFRAHEDREILKIVKENSGLIRERWHDHFRD